MEDELINAVMAHDINKVGSLIAGKVDINSNSNRAGTPPLVGAVLAGDMDLVGLLLSKGADVNGRAKDGRTPLLAAVGISSRGMVAQLLAAGADPDAKDNAGLSPLIEAKNRGLSDIERLMRPKGSAASAPVLPEPPKAVLYRNEVDAYETLVEDGRKAYEALR